MRCAPLASLLGLALALALSACGKDEPEPAPPPEKPKVEFTREEAEKKANEAAGMLMKALFEKLSKAMHEGPPHEALAICGDVAQEITSRVRKEQGIDVRRTSLRVRNPKNAPDDWERAWLETAQTREDVPPAGEAVVVGSELRFVRPLYLQEMCEKCHGPAAALSPEVSAALKRYYPRDAATGFRAGDLRGIVSVRVPLKPKR